MKTSKSKTFQKGEDYGDLIEWFMKQIETHEYQPEGTESYNDGLAPYDPVCELTAKYTIQVTKVDDRCAAKSHNGSIAIFGNCPVCHGKELI